MILKKLLLLSLEDIIAAILTEANWIDTSCKESRGNKTSAVGVSKVLQQIIRKVVMVLLLNGRVTSTALLKCMQYFLLV